MNRKFTVLIFLLLTSFVIEAKNVSTKIHSAKKRVELKLTDPEKQTTPLYLQASSMHWDDEIILYDSIPYNNIQKENWKLDADSSFTHISNITIPRLLVYKPEKSCGTGIIICPGGGYRTLNVQNTRFIANRLTEWGIIVFILVHRLPVDTDSPEKFVVSLQDVQTALEVLHNKAEKWYIDKDKIGLWGSSAGGHLAAMASTHFLEAFIPVNDITVLRPDFLILAWPVISFRPGLVHKDSMSNLLGINPSEKQIEFYSPDEWVDAKSPETFIVHAGDDMSVSVENSIRYYEALRNSNVVAELHVFEKGGHGFGIEPEVKDSWMISLYRWLMANELTLYQSNSYPD